MSPLTVFLAKFLGLYCIIVALAMMAGRKSAIATIRSLIDNPPLLLFVEVVGLAGGLAMVIGHNIWYGGTLPVIVTLVGWLMAVRGAGLLALSPGTTMKLFNALQYARFFYLYMGATLLLGLYLAGAGFST
jgi:hypothetical protein